MMEPSSKKSKSDKDDARNNPAPAPRGRGRPKGSTKKKTKIDKIVFPFTFKQTASPIVDESSPSALSESAKRIPDEVKLLDVIVNDAATNTMGLKILSSSESYDQTEKIIRDLYTSHQEAVSQTKLSQWCSNCYDKKSRFPCCWNTSYCSLECQKIHWENGHAGPCRHPSHPHQEEASTPETVSESEL